MCRKQANFWRRIFLFIRIFFIKNLSRHQKSHHQKSSQCFLNVVDNSSLHRLLSSSSSQWMSDENDLKIINVLKIESSPEMISLPRTILVLAPSLAFVRFYAPCEKENLLGRSWFCYCGREGGLYTRDVTLTEKPRECSLSPYSEASPTHYHWDEVVPLFQKSSTSYWKSRTF